VWEILWQIKHEWLGNNRWNLKKVLGMVLCLAMMLSIMVVGAGAAFADQSSIDSKHQEAVDAAVALHIIDGIPQNDGSTIFKPTTNVTREQMAKMICVLDNGGKDPQLATGKTFTDVAADRWSNKYIESCATRGVVAGVGGGKFNPGGDVTATQAAKMLLVELGYKEDLAKYTGSAWATNVNIDATKKGYYDELEDIDVTAPLTREHAAQMIWNALQAKEIEYTNVLVTDPVTGQLTSKVDPTDKNDTLLHDKYGGDIYTGILQGSGQGCGSSVAGKEKITVNVKTKNGVDLASASVMTFKRTEDTTDLLYQNVKVLVNSKNEAYGVFAVADENTVVTAKFSDVKRVDGEKVKIDGTEYKYVAGADTLKIFGATADPKSENLNTLETTAFNSADTITFISNDGDSKFDIAYVNQIQSIDKVTYVSKDSFSAGGEVKFDEVTAPSDLAKDDYVVKTKDLFTGDSVYVKADAVKGKITSSKGATDHLTDVYVDGTWYQIANATANKPFSGAVTLKSTLADIDLNSTYTFQVVDGVVYNAKLESAGSTDTALVLGASGQMDIDGNYQAKLLLADGTTKVVPAKAVYSANALKDDGSNLANAFVTYEIKDGVYELTKIDGTNKLNKDDYQTGSYGFVKATKMVNSTRIADTAVIYVQYKDGDDMKTKVMTGKQLNAMGSNFGTTTAYVVDGSTICAAAITAQSYLPGASADKLYGYITSDVTDNNDGGTTYKSFTVWTNKGESVDVKMKSSVSVDKGQIIQFEMGEDNFIEGVKNEATLGATTAAIKDFGSDYAIFYKSGATGTTDVSFDDDIAYLYLNTKDQSGINGGELAKADETDTANEYYANCKYVKEGDKIILIAIDTNLNKWDGAANIANHT